MKRRLLIAGLLNPVAGLALAVSMITNLRAHWRFERHEREKEVS